MQYWRSARIHFTVCSSSVWGGQDLRAVRDDSIILPSRSSCLDEDVSGRPFFSREADLGSRILLSYSWTSRDRSLSHLFIVLAVRIVCLLGSGPRRRSGVSTYPDTVNEQHLGSILGMWPMFPSNMRFEPSILVSPDQTKLFAIVWESFRLHLCFVFTLTCTVRP